jgi:hypothetical protein
MDYDHVAQGAGDRSIGAVGLCVARANMRIADVGSRRLDSATRKRYELVDLQNSAA